MAYKTNTQTYNTSTSKIANFNDFNPDEEKEELKKVRRSINPNTPDTQQYPGNQRYKFNKMTRKMDEIDDDLIDDELDSLEDEKKNEKFFGLIKSAEEKAEERERIRQLELNALKNLIRYTKKHGRHDLEQEIKDYLDSIGEDYAEYDLGHWVEGPQDQD